jgi:hypothetical protein
MIFRYGRLFRDITLSFKRLGAVVTALSAGIMAFFTGVAVPVTIWEKLTDPARRAPSADAPVIAFGLILGAVMAIAAFIGSVWWLWPRTPMGMNG